LRNGHWQLSKSSDYSNVTERKKRGRVLAATGRSDDFDRNGVHALVNEILQGIIHKPVPRHA
jgi:hypothetical protein